MGTSWDPCWTLLQLSAGCQEALPTAVAVSDRNGFSAVLADEVSGPRTKAAPAQQGGKILVLVLDRVPAAPVAVALASDIGSRRGMDQERHGLQLTMSTCLTYWGARILILDCLRILWPFGVSLSVAYQNHLQWPHQMDLKNGPLAPQTDEMVSGSLTG